MSQSHHCEPTPPVAHLGSGESCVAAPVAVRPMTSGSHEEIFFHPDLLRSLRIHRRLVMAIVGAGIAFALAYFLKTWPVYVAESLVYIQPAPPRLMGNGMVQSWPYDENTYESYMQQQVNNVTRSDVLRGALHRLPAGSWQHREESEQAAMERLSRALTVGRIGTSYQIGIAARSSGAATAAQISNAVAGSFIEIAKSDLRAGDPQRIKLLSEERDRIEKALVQDRAEQEELNKAMGVAAVGAQAADPYDAQISELRVELAKARAAHDEAGARLTAVAATNSSASAALDAEADEIVVSDPGLVSMKASLNQRRALLISQMANLTSNHPQSKQDAEELAQINASLENMMKDLRAKAAAHIQQRLRNDLERSSALESKLNAQVAQLSSVAGSATPRMQRSNDLATDIQRLQNRFTAVDEQYRNLTMENNAPGAAYISAVAVPPLHASVSHMMRNVMIILLGTLLFAVVAAVAAHNLDPRIYIATDVERVLGFSPMAQLPDFHQVSGEVNEEYMLRLAAAIEHAYQQGGFKSCIFTGVGPGAGVTTVAARVRNMLEGMGRSTVLVDATGAPPPDSSDPANQESKTGLVPAGHENRPSSLLQQMAEEMDSETIVLTDTAPLLASGETEYLARFVDSAIVVIQSGLTTRAQLREVAQTLRRLEVAAVGFVLNRISIEKANPSFRQSVRAVEQRLAAQSRSHARHAPRPRPSAHHDHEIAEESFVVTKPEPVEPPVPSPSPDASRQPSSVNRPPAEPSFATTTSRTPVAEVESTPSTRVARGRGEPHRPAAVPKSPRPTAAEQVAAAPIPPPAELVDSSAAAAAEPTPAPEPPRAPIPPVRRSPESTVSRVAEHWAPPLPPAPSPVRNEPSPDDLATERDDPGYTAASRLGGLRNLLVSLGRRSLTKDGDSGSESDSDLEPRFERATMRPAYAESSLADSDVSGSGAPARLTAQPEFLPPKPILEVEKEKETVRPTPPRRDNPDGDEIQTLPSWRGQYRKKRYPPV